MLEHVPTLLAASGLDMCVGHPAVRSAAVTGIKRGSQASAPPSWRNEQSNTVSMQCKSGLRVSIR